MDIQQFPAGRNTVFFMEALFVSPKHMTLMGAAQSIFSLLLL
jgi:hypothetical protein